MNAYKNVYVTGSIAYDTIMNFPNQFQSYFHAEKLHQINVSFVVNKLEKQIGGTTCNIAYNISLITNSKSFDFAQDKFLIKLLGSVGKDGKEFINFFRENKTFLNSFSPVRFSENGGDNIGDIKKDHKQKNPLKLFIVKFNDDED